MGSQDKELTVDEPVNQAAFVPETSPEHVALNRHRTNVRKAMNSTTFLLLGLFCVASASGKLHIPNSGQLRFERGTTHKCGAGEYYQKENDQCQPCPDGHFMTEQMAKEKEYHMCYVCYKADRATHEIELEPCTPTRDTIVGCEDNYYQRQQAPSPKECPHCNFECTGCTICHPGYYEKQRCLNETDTLCCPMGNVPEKDLCVTTPFTTSGIDGRTITTYHAMGTTETTPSTIGSPMSTTSPAPATIVATPGLVNVNTTLLKNSCDIVAASGRLLLMLLVLAILL